MSGTEVYVSVITNSEVVYLKDACVKSGIVTISHSCSLETDCSINRVNINNSNNYINTNNEIKKVKKTRIKKKKKKNRKKE